MEKKFYNDNFEKLLKEKIDEFKMLPSKRIWHSIYNDLHPGRKWPSITISLLVITTLSFVGYFNATPANKQTTINNIAKKFATPLIDITDNTILKNTLRYTNTTSNYNNIISQKNKIIAKRLFSNNKTKQQDIKSKNEYTIATEKTSYLKEIDNKVAVTNLSPFTTNNNPIQPALYDNSKTTGTPSLTSEALPQLINDKASDEYIYNNLVFENSDIAKQQIHNPLSDNDKTWIDNYVLYNKSLKKTWKGNVSYQLYATPNISFRELINRNKFNASDNKEFNNLNQHPDFGIETGVALIYPVAKNIRIKSSLQFNFTNYSFNALKTDHPILTTLMMQDINTKYSYLEPKLSAIYNEPTASSSKFHNSTCQLSLPFGIEFKIAGKNKFKWYASTSIQPTYIIGGSAYLISYDKKNYVSYGSLIRKWNINTAVGIFASYQTPNGIQLQIGPQYRYQLISTYKRYGLSENLYHLGIQLGVGKNF